MGSSAPLDSSPRKNWVEQAGGLPPFVREVVRELIKQGMTKQHAVATALSRIKAWAATGNPKAAAALADWEKTRARNRAQQAGTGVAAGNPGPVMSAAVMSAADARVLELACRRAGW